VAASGTIDLAGGGIKLLDDPNEKLVALPAKPLNFAKGLLNVGVSLYNYKGK